MTDALSGVETKIDQVKEHAQVLVDSSERTSKKQANELKHSLKQVEDQLDRLNTESKDHEAQLEQIEPLETRMNHALDNLKREIPAPKADAADDDQYHALAERLDKVEADVEELKNRKEVAAPAPAPVVVHERLEVRQPQVFSVEPMQSTFVAAEPVFVHAGVQETVVMHSPNVESKQLFAENIEFTEALPERESMTEHKLESKPVENDGVDSEDNEEQDLLDMGLPTDSASEPPSDIKNQLAHPNEDDFEFVGENGVHQMQEVIQFEQQPTPT